MRIHELNGWPPSQFASADKPHEDCAASEPKSFRLASVAYINGKNRMAAGDLVLVLEDIKTGEQCTARMKIAEPEIGRKLEQALSLCKGMTLDEVGHHELSDN